MELLLRVLAECADEPRARELSAELLEALRPFTARERAAPQRYWKEPRFFEFTLALTPPNEGVFTALLTRSRDGWTHLGDADDRSSVWNHAPGRSFLIAEARWAEVLLGRS